MTKAEKPRFREHPSRGLRSDSITTPRSAITDQNSHVFHRSRNMLVIHARFASQLNQSAVPPGGVSDLQTSISISGNAMVDACIAPLIPERNQPMPLSCWRTASAENASRPSVPHPKVWTKKITTEIGTKTHARIRVFPNLPS